MSEFSERSENIIEEVSLSSETDEKYILHSVNFPPDDIVNIVKDNLNTPTDDDVNPQVDDIEKLDDIKEELGAKLANMGFNMPTNDDVGEAIGHMRDHVQAQETMNIQNLLQGIMNSGILDKVLPQSMVPGERNNLINSANQMVGALIGNMNTVIGNDAGNIDGLENDLIAAQNTIERLLNNRNNNGDNEDNNEDVGNNDV